MWFFFVCLNKLWNDSFLQEKKKIRKKDELKKKRGFFANNIRQHKINLAFAMKLFPSSTHNLFLKIKTTTVTVW